MNKADFRLPVVNNAGGGTFKPLMEVTPEQLQHEFGANVFGTIYLTQATVDTGKMPKGGRIINISSIAAKQGLAGLVVYCAAKAAQDSLTESLASEVSDTFGTRIPRTLHKSFSYHNYSSVKAMELPSIRLLRAPYQQMHRSRFSKSRMGRQATCRSVCSLWREQRRAWELQRT